MLPLACLVVPAVDAVIGRGVAPTIGDPVLGYRPNPAFPDHDSAGFHRDRPATTDVVTFGDSQTYGHASAGRRLALRLDVAG